MAPSQSVTPKKKTSHSRGVLAEVRGAEGANFLRLFEGFMDSEDPYPDLAEVVSEYFFGVSDGCFF